MKHTTKLLQLIAVVIIIMFSSCSDENMDLNNTHSSIPDVLSKANTKKINADVILSPSGDLTGVVDANAIEAALNSLPAGGTILLEEGTFYVNREMFVPGFSGTLTGSGKDATEIVGVGDDLTPFFLGTFFFFLEPSGEMAVKNLSLLLPDDFRSNIGNLYAFMIVRLSSDGSDTHFDNLRLSGTDAFPGLDPIFVSQPNNGIVVEGDFSAFPSFSSGGLHTLSNSEFSKIAFQATQHQGLKNATVKVSDNHYKELKQTIYRWMDGCSVSITNNTMETFSFGAIVVTQEGVPVPGEPNSVVIRGNTVATAGFMPIEIGWIPDGAAYYKLLIEKNTLTNLGPDPIGIFSNLTGMGIFYGNEGAVVRNNIIRGEADFGIIQGSQGGTFSGNNLNGINVLAAGYGLFSDNNTVVGTGTATVIDGGTGNIVTGLTKVPGESIGDRIKEAQVRRKEILDEFNTY